MAHRHRALRAVPIILILALIGAWSVFLYTFGAEQLVAAISVKNGYILAFFVAVFGGISSLTSTSFYLTIITLAVGGLNPLLLGIVGGAGVTVGDSLFYYLGSRSRQLLSGRMREQVERISRWVGTKPDWAIAFGVYIYCGFTFLSNDILAVALALARFPFRKAALSIFLGNMTAAALVGYLATGGLRFLF